jgi:CRP-like cAMP-binding protein
LRIGEPLYALWALLAIKSYAPLSNSQPLFQRLALDQAQRDEISVGQEPMSMQTSVVNEHEEMSGLITALEGEELISQAHAVALDWSALDEEPSRQKSLPLLSSFDELILGQLLNTLELKSLTPGELMIEEGEEADGVYWLSAGEVEVTRRNQDKETITLAQLNAGSIIGEMGLITKSPRVATVTAMVYTQAIVLPSQAYALLDAYSDTVHQTLSHLVGRRMLENLTKFSPVFKALPPEAHPELLSQFKAKVVPGGEVLLRQGKPGRGLYLILDGLVQVTQLGSIQSKWLREGDIFGEISLVYDSPVSATCTAARRSLLYMLDPDRFKELVSQYPEIKHTLAELSLFRNLDELYMMT